MESGCITYYKEVNEMNQRIIRLHVENQEQKQLTAFEQLGPKDKFLLALVFIGVPLVLIGLIVGVGF